MSHWTQNMTWPAASCYVKWASCNLCMHEVTPTLGLQKEGSKNVRKIWSVHKDCVQFSCIQTKSIMFLHGRKWPKADAGRSISEFLKLQNSVKFLVKLLILRQTPNSTNFCGLAENSEPYSRVSPRNWRGHCTILPGISNWNYGRLTASIVQYLPTTMWW